MNSQGILDIYAIRKTLKLTRRQLGDIISQRRPGNDYRPVRDCRIVEWERGSRSVPREVLSVCAALVLDVWAMKRRATPISLRMQIDERFAIHISPVLVPLLKQRRLAENIPDGLLRQEMIATTDQAVEAVRQQILMTLSVDIAPIMPVNAGLVSDLG